LADSAPNTITGLTWLRELSDGFLYEKGKGDFVDCQHCEDGTVYGWVHPDGRWFGQTDLLDKGFCDQLVRESKECPQCGGTGKTRADVRNTKELPCPKIGALKELLSECDETGRIVIFGAFTGTIDRITSECRKAGWSVVRCDGRGMVATDRNGDQVDQEPLRFWKDWNNDKVAFVAHPESGGYGLTLTESRMAVFYSNVHKSEVRVQAEDRIHRPGMDVNKGCEIVDLFHLPSDERIWELVREDRRIELMTLGEVVGDLNAK
jgi:SNF2 family DNA or RNA helicase